MLQLFQLLSESAFCVSHRRYQFCFTGEGLLELFLVQLSVQILKGGTVNGGHLAVRDEGVRLRQSAVTTVCGLGEGTPRVQDLRQLVELRLHLEHLSRPLWLRGWLYDVRMSLAFERRNPAS